MEKHLTDEAKQLSGMEFNFLSIYEQKRKVTMARQDKIIQENMKRDKELDEKKPAFFQKNAMRGSDDWRQQEFENYKKLQKETEMDFDPNTKTHEEIRDFFKVSAEKDVLTDMNSKMFDSMFTRLKQRQISHYAFLNKEFNVMNYKSARCSMHCFDSVDRPVAHVNECLKVCRQGIQECREFAFNLQKESEAELKKC